MKNVNTSKVSRLVSAEHHKAMIVALKEFKFLRFESDSADTIRVYADNRRTGKVDEVYTGLCKTGDGRGNWIVRYPIELFNVTVS